MRSYLFFSIAILFVLTVHCSSNTSPAGEKTPKAVFIIVDGIPADVIEKLDPSV